ncbi:hypothetical protein RJ639_044792 [Escallonia herrerae]|uniref:Uncharacterized protein n=1 Tax=Escallonia herrerae TaxID=1293975 RepID=A0AA88W9J2_9ASTE|nr:hypothetical protein RJ639_044792 [Escallonia herrerae]
MPTDVAEAIRIENFLSNGNQKLDANYICKALFIEQREECPSGGSAFVFGKDIRLNSKAARQHIGYCPQFDALLEFVTVKEHLELYARIKGVPDHKLEEFYYFPTHSRDMRGHFVVSGKSS